MDDYEKLLDKGYKKLPKKSEEEKRFSIPVLRAQKAGARTIIINILEVAGSLRREAPHLVKFLLKELATKGDMEGQRLTVLGNFSEEHLNKKLDIYVKRYVLCPKCNKPDTKITKEQNSHLLVCEACGNRQPIARVK